jgi:hypothetical protein
VHAQLNTPSARVKALVRFSTFDNPARISEGFPRAGIEKTHIFRH